MTADANRSSIAFQEETDWGVIPTSPALTGLRFKGESLAHDKTTVVSEEIRADRQVSDLVEVGAQASGGVSIELSYAEYKPFIEAALFTELTVVNFSGAAAIDLSDQSVIAAAGSFDNVVAGCTVRLGGATNAASNGLKRVVSKTGDGTTMILAAGSIAADESVATLTVKGTHGRNGTEQKSFTLERCTPDTSGTPFYQRFTGMTLDTLTLNVETKKIITGDMTFLGKIGSTSSAGIMDSTAEAADGTLTFTGNAVADETFTVGGVVYTWKASPTTVANQVKVGTDANESINNADAAIRLLAGSGSLYGSATVINPLVTSANGAGDTLVITAKTPGVAGNSLGTTETMTNASFGAATLTGGVAATAIVAQTTNPVMNGTTNVGNLTRNGLALSEHFKMATIAIKNNLRGKDAIGEKGNFEIGSGRFEVTGTLQAYFRNNELLAAFIAHDYSSFGFTITDSAGNTIAIHIPRMNFNKGNPNVTGINTDVMAPLDFQAILDPTLGGTLFVSFVPAS